MNTTNTQTNNDLAEFDDDTFECLERNSGAECFEDRLGAVEVLIARILRDRTLQVRTRMDDRLIDSYAKAMLHSAKFPPVRLGNLGKSLVIIDGWHRIAAASLIGMTTVMASIERVTHKEAMLAASLTNLTHGKPLSRTEKREAFKMFIKGWGYRITSKKWMSYREIAVALGGIAGHTTIRGWMQKDFPSVYRAMGAGEPTGYGEAGPPKIDLERTFKRQAQEALDDGLAFFKILNLESRYECYQMAHKMVKEMEQHPMKEPEF